MPKPSNLEPIMEHRYYQPTEDYRLKPMHLAAQQNSSSTSLTTTFSSVIVHETYYPLEASTPFSGRDEKLKKQIRVLRFVDRLLTTIVSITTLVPLIQTIVKFLQTRNILFEVDGKERSAWANDTIAWFTYMYASFAAVSTFLNLVVLAMYFRSIRAANRASTVSFWWTMAILTSHVVAWAIAAGVYRYGKEPDAQGKHRDLWGWTCSATAQDLQNVLTSVNFQKYCTVQTTSFYSGVASVALGVLSAVITIMTFARMRTKKRMARATTDSRESDLEPLRA